MWLKFQNSLYKQLRDEQVVQQGITPFHVDLQLDYISQHSLHLE